MNETVDRRNFLRRSSVATLIGLMGQSKALAAGPEVASVKVPEEATGDFYRLLDTHTKPEVLEIYKEHPDNPLGIGGEARTQLLFYYDQTKKQFINPINVLPDPTVKSGKRKLDIEILNMHVSGEMNEEITTKSKGDLQLQLGVTVPANEQENYTWILLNGIDVFYGGTKEGRDERLRHFVDNNKPTDKLSSETAIEIGSGRGKLQIQAMYQRRKSAWRSFLTAITGTMKSPVFGILPIPRLVSEGLTFVSAALGYIQSKDALVPVWSSARLDFKIIDGYSEIPFTLRPGLWLTMDRSVAKKMMDDKRNIGDLAIDVGGQFYEVVTKKEEPVDANYSVLRFDFPEIKGS